MKCKIQRDGFLRTLQRVQGIVEKRSTMPVLSNILIETLRDRIKVTATDLEVFINESCSVSIEENGSATVNAKKLFEIIRELQSEYIDLSTTTTGSVRIRSGRSLFNILGLPAAEFPSFPELDACIEGTVGSGMFQEMIYKTCYAASTDETRYNINGVLLEMEGGGMRMVATDGHRLSLIERDVDGIPEIEKGVILPKKGVMEIKKLLEEREGSFDFALSKSYFAVKTGDTEIVIRLIDGEFPDYEQVVPKDNDKRVVAGRRELIGSLKRVSILSSERMKGVKFSLSDGKLDLSSSSPDLGEAREELDVDYSGGDMEIGYNAKYFIDALDVIETDDVVLEVKGELNPGIIRATVSDGYTYVIMPMRI